MLRAADVLYGIQVKEIARICGVDLSTARRWKRGAKCPPQTALMLLSRDLGFLAPEWAGWTINGEDLVSPDGWCVNRNDALIVPLMHGQIAALRAKIRDLEAADDTEGLEDQPAPGELPAIAG